MSCDHVCPISKINEILLATDGTSFSEGAIREAIAFAGKCSSRLSVVTVLETNPEYETIGTRVFEKEEAQLAQHLDAVKMRAAEAGLTCRTVLHSGLEPSRAIIEEAEEQKADMIVVGRRGRTGLAKLLMGEVPAKVIKHASCKVLVVPRAARIEFKKILVATDGSDHSKAAVREALGIAKCSESLLIALSSARDQSELTEAQALVKQVVETGVREGVTVESVTPIGKSSNAIIETAGGRGVDLVIMGSYGKTGLSKALMGSSTEKVIEQVGCAVLVIRAD